MINTREIRTKIKSIQSTQKITRAMEMVATSKMRRAQDKMYASRPYTEKISEVISHILKGKREYQHNYMQQRITKSVGFIVISTDRGLCGGLNVNLLKLLLNRILYYSSQNINIHFYVLGKKAFTFLKRYNYRVLVKILGAGDFPTLKSVYGLLNTALYNYNKGDVDIIELLYNEFVNTMVQKPLYKQLIPIAAQTLKTSVIDNDKYIFMNIWDYIYEPDSKEVLDVLIVRYLESLFYQGVVENIASEQAARRVAMKSASDNAAGLINDFKLVYNKVRQSTITQELSEIVSGADAV